MAKPVDEVAVLGAGVMGAAIAAHLANAGLKVLLLDIAEKDSAPEDKRARNRITEAGLERARTAKPAAFFSKRFETLVRAGNLEDDLGEAAKMDVIIEAVVENLAIKRALYERLDAMGGDAIVASNTSGLPLAELVAGRSAGFRKRFVITHFFNPPRYLKLVEFVAGVDTSEGTVARASHLCGTILGKGLVRAKDTPNFIANRVGTFGLLRTLQAAIEDGYTAEEADMVFGPATGRPKSAVFRTADVVGIDTLVHVAQNCHQALPDDERREVFAVPEVLRTMVERRWLGSKSRQGFYKKEADGSIAQLDLKSLHYVPQTRPRFASVGATRNAETAEERIRRMIAGDDRASALARTVIYETLIYAANRVGEIADDVVDIDRAMRWGFGWDLGPFETWDALGVEETAIKMKAAGLKVPGWVDERIAAGEARFYKRESATHLSQVRARGGYHAIEPDGALSLSEVRSWGGEVEKNGSASILDIGDGVFCLEFHGKMNAIDSDIVTMMLRAVDRAEQDGVGLVIGNEAKDAFCAGANLFSLMVGLGQNNYAAVDEILKGFQKAVMRTRYARVPVVCAPFGLALGGGAEVVLGCQVVRAAAELYVGCVEVGVGLIPAGGGCMEMAARAGAHAAGNPNVDLLALVRLPFEHLATARVSTSAEDARDIGYLHQGDTVSMARETVIGDAKQIVLGLVRAGHRAPPPRLIKVVGTSGMATMEAALHNLADAHRISEHDKKIGTHLARILSGGDVPSGTKVTEQTILDLEREAFLSLCGEEKTRARIQHMLTTSKPLRN